MISKLAARCPPRRSRLTARRRHARACGVRLNDGHLILWRHGCLNQGFVVESDSKNFSSNWPTLRCRTAIGAYRRWE